MEHYKVREIQRYFWIERSCRYVHVVKRISRVVSVRQRERERWGQRDEDRYDEKRKRKREKGERIDRRITPEMQRGLID